jgi:methylase of polypeptide subunit release factors
MNLSHPDKYGMIWSYENKYMNWLRRLIFKSMYYRRPPWDTGISPPELLAFIQSNPPGRALDLGCGTGTNVITLAKNGTDYKSNRFSAWFTLRNTSEEG